MLGLFYCIGCLAGKAVQAKLAMPTATATYIFYNIIPAAATAAAASSTTTPSTTTTTRSLLKFIAIVFDNKTVDVFTQVRLFNLIYILLFWNLNYLE
jgi:cellulase/cellobiase CelA1